ncbi:uncharacterized protein LOC144714483 isoform X1 [Wolffia australiana]
MARFLVVNGVVQAAAPPPAAVFLENVSGVYTTTRTDGDASAVLFWERHVKRLRNSVRILAERGGFSGSRFVLPSPPQFRALVDESLRTGLRRALENRESEGRTGEVVITAMIAEDQRSDGMDVIVHFGDYSPTGSGTRVAVAGRGRDMAEAKRTAWVRIRKGMEKRRGPMITELLLSNDGDRILEGSLTNFFVVCRHKEDGDESGESLEVQTAPVSDGILPGIVRELIIEICSKRGIHFRKTAPSWAERELWEEAFITNSLRLLGHVETIEVPRPWEDLDSKSWKEVSWEVKQFNEGPGAITSQIKRELAEAVAAEGLPLANFL